MKSIKGYIIATIRSIDRPDEPEGYRVTFNGQIKNVDYTSMRNAMAGSDCVENAKIKDNKIMGTSGSLDRYGVIHTGGHLIKNSMVILKKFGLTDKNKQPTMTVFQVVDANGVIEMCTADKALEYANGMGIANGKVVTKGDSKFISAINSEYPYEEVLEDIFCIDNKIDGYVSTGEVLRGRLAKKLTENNQAAKEAERITAEKADVDQLKAEVDNIERVITEASNNFNSGVRKALMSRGISYEIKQIPLVPKSNEAPKVDIIMYIFDINGEHCIVSQGQMLVKLKTGASYQWEVISYAKNNSGEILYDQSFKHDITEHLLMKRSLVGQALEHEIVAHSKKLGEITAGIVLNLKSIEKNTEVLLNKESNELDKAKAILGLSFPFKK